MKKIFTSVILVCCLAVQAQVQQWVSGYPTGSANLVPVAMTVDALGNNYITGYTISPTYYALKHFFLVKNNPAGVQQWAREYPQPDSFSSGQAVATDYFGNVYVTGTRYDTFCNICTVTIPESYSFAIKYNAKGDVVWHNRYDGATKTNQHAESLAVAFNGTVYITGTEQKYNPVTFVRDQAMFTQKISGDGQTRWVQVIPEAAGHAVALDKQQHPIVTGANVPGSMYQLSNIFTIKYQPNGEVEWQQHFDEYQKYGAGYYIKTDASGNIYVNGQTDTLTFYNVPRIITLKYSPQGQLMWWQKEPPRTSTLPGYYGGFDVDKWGNSYIAGTNAINYPNDDWHIAKRNSHGVLLWSRQYNDSLNGSDKPSGGIVADKWGNVTVAGYSNFYSNVPFTTISYDAEGNEKWQAFYKAAPFSNNYPMGIATDLRGNVYVGGGSNGQATIVKYKQRTWRAADLKIPASKAALENDKSIILYPNPAEAVLQVQLAGATPGRYEATITNVAGMVARRQVLTITQPKGSHQLNVSMLPPGNYRLTLSKGTDRFSNSFIKK